MFQSCRQRISSRSRFTKWLVRNEIFTKRFPIKFEDDKFSEWKGKTVIITGVTRGIGFIILKKLLRLEMNVIIGCRNTMVCRETLFHLQENEGIDISKATILELDFMLLGSIHSFVNKLKESNTPVHLFINNARFIGGNFSETVDGFETHFQANCLSPFLLINLLIPILVSTSTELGSPIVRIVNVSSGLICFGKIDFNDLEQRNSYNSYQVFFNTQLIQILLLRQLFTNLRQNGHSRINVCAVHPGITACELPCRKITKFLLNPFLTTREDGANQVLYIALSSKTENTSGEFFIHPNEHKNCKDDVAFVGNQNLQEKIWNLISSLVSSPDHNQRHDFLHANRRNTHNFTTNVENQKDLILFAVMDNDF